MKGNKSVNKSTKKKSGRRKKKHASTVSNNQILNTVTEKSKKRKKRTKVEKESIVKNGDIVQEESKYDKGLIITKEIEMSELEDYLTRESKIIEKNIDKKINKEKKQEEEIVEIIDNDEVISDKDVVVDSGFSLNVNRIFILMFSLLFIFIIGFCAVTIIEMKNDNKTSSTVNETSSASVENDYKNCLQATANEKDINEDIATYINDLNSDFGSKYDVSVMYVDLNNNYSYSYNKDMMYYAGNSIKIVDALYVYDRAAKGELDLNALRELVVKGIQDGNDEAYRTLRNYIGIDNLRNYGDEIGAVNLLVGDDEYGFITVEDAIKYLKELNKYIISNNDLGKELQSYFGDASNNYLNIPDLNIRAIHNSGLSGSYYHEMGIVYDNNPYVIVILSKEGNNDVESMVKDINLKIYALHKLYIENRDSNCKKKYGN